MNCFGLFDFIMLMAWILVLGFFFAKVEIQIEGPNGWAESLPTWRIDEHWLLDIFWGGRPMTGYHAWVFTFMMLVFHLPVFMHGLDQWTLKEEARIIASLQIFWTVEDFLWFVLNPAYGISKFSRHMIPWHKKWFLFMPVDYWTFLIVAGLLMWYSLS